MAVNERFPWVPVSAVVAMVLVATVASIRVPNEGVRMPPTEGLPAFGLTRINPEQATELLAEQLAAYDPAPLFIPSAMNNNDPELPSGIRPGAHGPFPDLPVVFTRAMALAFPSSGKVPGSSVDGLKLTESSDAPLGLARAEASVVNAGQNRGAVEVLRVGGDSIVLAMGLPVTGDLPDADGQPLELLGAVTRTGLAGELVVNVSSGSIEMDDYFRSLLRKNLLIGSRLPVGFYMFRIGR